MAEQILLAISSFPDVETANRVAHTLVAEKLAACANIIPAVHSIYRWKDKIETAGEVIVLFKTTPDRQAAFQEKLQSLHRPGIAGLPSLGCRKLRYVVAARRRRLPPIRKIVRPITFAITVTLMILAAKISRLGTSMIG